MVSKDQELIYDWNEIDFPKPNHKITFDDETLRDGLQSPSVKNPPIEEQIQILHCMENLGIEAANIGLPGAGPHVLKNVIRLAEEIRDQKLNIEPNCAARTLQADIEPIIEAVEKTGLPIVSALFIGSSPIRQYVEGWDIDLLLKHTETAVKFAVANGLEVMFVTEDTTRSKPNDIKRLYTTAIECGAKRLVVCDTVGHATPNGTSKLIQFVRKVADETGVDGLTIEWHGHRDRGLDLINCIAAASAGANQIHGAGLGIGERVGNAPMDLLLVNFKLLGWIDKELTSLPNYCETISKFVDVEVPYNYPVFGKDAFETSTGVHAAAVIKAMRKEDSWLANRVYSGVPADEFGLEQVISVGPMSGKSNVIFWLEHHGFEATESLVEKVFQQAKNSNRVLTDSEIKATVNAS